MGWLLSNRLSRGIHAASSLFTINKAQTSSRNASAQTKKFPPNPHELLRGRLEYELPLLRRRVDTETDNPLAAVYRIYEHIMLDQHIEIRNEFEAFWFHSDWKVGELPNPEDPDPARYAVVACIPALLCLAFNRRIELGLPRDAPPIFTHDQLDEWRSRERVYETETEPTWTAAVPRVNETLAIPHWDNKKRDFVPLDSFDTDMASDEFKQKNCQGQAPGSPGVMPPKKTENSGASSPEFGTCNTCPLTLYSTMQAEEYSL